MVFLAPTGTVWDCRPTDDVANYAFFRLRLHVNSYISPNILDNIFHTYFTFNGCPTILPRSSLPAADGGLTWQICNRHAIPIIKSTGVLRLLPLVTIPQPQPQPRPLRLPHNCILHSHQGDPGTTRLSQLLNDSVACTSPLYYPQAQNLSSPRHSRHIGSLANLNYSQPHTSTLVPYTSPYLPSLI